ncbi:LRP2-binding protein [Fasciola gigantica]|uniref:LRP2-binding protein n=1 Tax=Fasciola gigantica TaxID=46835 RepID=A0A504YTN2_FASGI|nr:LRP2-binding protein [Fasciola gigantica]
MDDLLSGLPKEIPAASLPRAYLRITRELLELNAKFDPENVNYETVDSALEDLLRIRIERGDEQAPFQLGQVFFEKNDYKLAWNYFRLAVEKYNDPRAKYQMGVMLYDNLVEPEQAEEFKKPQTEACRLFEEITQLKFGPQHPVGQRQLVYHAAYNLGRAYHQGFGVYPSSEKALGYFLLAANDGDRNACIYAQTALGYLYSGPGLRDLEKAFYWHTEACGNGSVESQLFYVQIHFKQGALGVHVPCYGLGENKSWTIALICLSEAANRGSLYAKASLVYYYYKRKMFTNAAALANKIIYFEEDAECHSAEYLRNFQLRAKAMACFIYARCLHQGLGIKEDRERAMELYAKSIQFDAVLACCYQRMAQNDEL